MSTRYARMPAPEPAILRLEALSPLDGEARDLLNDAVARARTLKPRSEIIVEGEQIKEPMLILDGWAARVRHLADGRRQILGFLLPGDLIGLCDQHRPVAASTVVAITPVEVCAAPDAEVSPRLARAFAISRALEDAHLLAQITRLGRMNAHERLADLLLELLERLQLAGKASGGSYTLPVTQEGLADALGLTSVHVNRTLQTMRRDDEIVLKGGSLTVVNPPLLTARIGRNPTRVSEG